MQEIRSPVTEKHDFEARDESLEMPLLQHLGYPDSDARKKSKILRSNVPSQIVGFQFST